jgi:hypothetical protein
MEQTAQTVAVRPLDKGMVLDKASQSLPDGAFVRLKNLFSSTEGPTRRPGYTRFAAGAIVPYPMVDYVTAWTPDGLQQNILITEKTLFRVSPALGYDEIEWGFAGTDMTVIQDAFDTFILEDLGATFLSEDFKIGDIVRIGIEEAVVTEVQNNTRFLAQGTLTEGTGYDYKIQRAFGPGNAKLVDWVIHEGFLLLADGKRPLMQYDLSTGTISYWIDAPGKFPPFTTTLIPACVASFQDRVWLGYTEDDVDGIQRQRIRWSGLADNRNFSITTNYLDLPYVNGVLLRLVPQNVSLVAYFDDGIYRGTQTNYPTLPLRFDPVETGGAGLVGPKAINAFLGGHFFVGQDDIYFLSLEGARRIGTPIARDSLRKSKELWRSYVAVDPWNYSIVFGIPENNTYMENLWRFSYKTEGWSYDDIQTYMVANPIVNAQLSWDDLSGEWDDLGLAFPTWDDINVNDPRKLLYVERGGRLWKSTARGETDFEAGPIAVELVSKDHDLDNPDSIKTVVRLALKIEAEEPLLNPLIFSVFVSPNRGRVWKAVGTLTVRVGYDEGYVNFRSTGSTFMFKLVSDSAVRSYSITEYTMRIRSSGEELDVTTQA